MLHLKNGSLRIIKVTRAWKNSLSLFYLENISVPVGVFTLVSFLDTGFFSPSMHLFLCLTVF